jgi:hypothetical protein
MILDIFPLREIAYYFVRKVNKKEVAIDIGIGQIIELKKSKVKLIYNINLIIGIIQILSAIFVLTIASLFITDIISIDSVTIGSETIPQITAEYIFTSILVLFGIILLFCGPLWLYYNQELKTIGI